MSASSRTAGPLIAVVALLLSGCREMSQSIYLSGYERDIRNATREIETARDNTQRAAGYAQRGRAYSEKARYSRSFKLISADEYGRVFGLAVKDHDQSVALDPASAEVYFSRGRTYYDRAALEDVKDAKQWFDPAAADFEKAVERDSKHFMAWDFLGLVHQQTGELDQAIVDYTREMELNSLGRSRLADAYCTRGSTNQQAKKYDAAIADYEKAIEFGGNADSCSCDPYNPLAALYDIESHRYDKSWEVVHKARKAGKWIMPEMLESLKKNSGRSE